MPSQESNQNQERKDGVITSAADFFRGSAYQSSVLAFLGISKPARALAVYKGVCKSFLKYALTYEEKIPTNLKFLATFNAKAVTRSIQQEEEVKTLETEKQNEQNLNDEKKAEEIKLIIEKYESRSNAINKKYSRMMSQLGARHTKENANAERIANNPQTNEVLFKEHLELLHAFQELLDEELQKKSWWDKRVRYSTIFAEDQNMNSASYWLLMSIIAVCIGMILEMCAMLACLSTAEASVAVKTAIVASFYTPAIILIPMAIIFGIILIAHFKLDIRPIKNRLENEPLSAVSNSLEEKFNEIKENNKPEFLPPMIDRVNPFAAMQFNNTNLRTFCDAIENRITFFEGERKKISDNKPAVVTPSVAPSFVS